jgi:hypothetical protein
MPADLMAVWGFATATFFFILLDLLERPILSAEGLGQLTGLLIMSPCLGAIPVCIWGFLRYFIWKALWKALALLF